jgi:membrane peptidoglycan carboxypeptidase
MPLHDLNRVMIRRNRRKTEKEGRLSNRLKPAGFTFLLIISLVLAGGMIALASLYVKVTSELPPVEQAARFFDPSDGLILQPSRLYDRTGQTELLTLDNPGSLRAYVWLDTNQDSHFPTLLAKAVVALNQPDFWQSSGSDWKHWSDPAPRTLAENLVSRLLLWQEDDSPERAIRMRLLAWQMTSTYGREKVLEWYLNSASFGRRITGAESAARVYFGLSSADINEAETALLAGLSTAPALNPHDSPQAADELMRSTLDKLADAGVFTAEMKQTALDAGLTIQKAPDAAALTTSPAFTRLALLQLGELVSDDRLALGGLQIRTTLDLIQQEQLDCALKAQLNRLESTGTDTGQKCAAARLLPALPPVETPLPADTQAAGILIDPTRGEILALSGKSALNISSDIYENMQGGTVLNPFMAAAVFSRGYSPASLMWDLPEQPVGDTSPLTKDTAVNYRGPIRLRTALVADRLNPLEDLLDRLGARTIWRLVRPLGPGSLENAYAPEKLLEGGGSVSLLEIVQGMSVFANLGDMYGLQLEKGEPLQPSTLLSMEDSYGNPIFTKDLIHRQPVVSAPLAYLVHNVLSDENQRRAELGYPNPFELGRPAGAKYGSTADGREIWAAGYTTQRTAVIWMGTSEGATFPAAVGVRAAGGIWNAVMRQSLTDQPASDWAVPVGVSKVEVCDPSGLLPTKACPSRVTDVFLDGSEPNTVDDLYRTIQVNRETGKIATVFTAPELVEDAVYLSVPEKAREWARAAGKILPPTDYDTIQTSIGSPTAKIDRPALFSLVHGAVSIQGTAAGDEFQNYRLQIGKGLNPDKWVEITENTMPVTDGELGVWDTTGLDGLYAIRLLLVRTDNRLETALSQITIDGTPPVVNIINPQPESTVSGSTPVFLQAEVIDSSAISKVEWIIDDKPAGESQQAPFTFNLTEPARGSHTLIVAATDAAGNRTVSEPVTFTVQ